MLVVASSVVVQPDGITTKPPHCVLCQTTTGPFHVEDVFAKWITRVLPTPTAPIERGRGDSPRATHRSNILEAKLRKAVCRPCNNGWMSQLEDDVRDVLAGAMSPTARTVPVTLNRDDQQTVAFWAVEKALLLELALRQSLFGYTPGHIPAHHLTWLYEQRETRPVTPGRA